MILHNATDTADNARGQQQQHHDGMTRRRKALTISAGNSDGEKDNDENDENENNYDDTPTNHYYDSKYSSKHRTTSTSTTTTSSRTLTKKKKKRKRRQQHDDDSFLCLFLRVATTFAFMLLVFYASYLRLYYDEPTSNNYNLQQLNNAAMSGDDDDNDTNEFAGDVQENILHKQQEVDTVTFPPTTIPPLPVWNLTRYAQDWDAYALANLLLRKTNNNNNNEFWKAAQALRQDFAETYGGENSVRAILDRALTTFGMMEYNYNNDTSTSTSNNTMPADLHETACRIFQSASNQHQHGNVFQMSFGGYSVTSGRGNYFSQSFPLVLERRLQTVMESLLSSSTTTKTKTSLAVRNAAIGGCPSFPYGWCLRNFLTQSTSNSNSSQPPPHVISWDFSMNEAGTGIDPAAGLEAYVRQALTQFTSSSSSNRPPPKLIIKDTHMAVERKEMLKYYYDYYHNNNNMTTTTERNGGGGVITMFDPVIVHTDPAVRPFLDMKERNRPIGFQSWRKFGSPPGAPGQALHHPAVKEHEFIAWVLTMHFLSAMEIVALQQQIPDLNEKYRLHCPKEESIITTEKKATSQVQLPPPLYPEALNQTKPWTSILYGEPSVDDHTVWKMNSIHCRTTFEPITHGDFSSTTIIASGSVMDTEDDIDIMLPKSSMFYNQGWVLDLSDAEKHAKQNLKRFGDDDAGLGFVDSKKAFYGVYNSGPLQLLLPFESSSNNNNDNNTLPKIGDMAKNWFKSVVLCQVNEKPDYTVKKPCTMDQDLEFNIGGIPVTTTWALEQTYDVATNTTNSNTSNNTKVAVTTLAHSMDASGTLYLGRKLCMFIPVPDNATLSTRIEWNKYNNNNKGGGGDDEQAPKLLFPDNMKDPYRDNQVGLPVLVRVSSQHIIQREQACSLSHVIWEQMKS